MPSITGEKEGRKERKGKEKNLLRNETRLGYVFFILFYFLLVFELGKRRRRRDSLVSAGGTYSVTVTQERADVLRWDRTYTYITHSLTAETCQHT